MGIKKVKKMNEEIVKKKIEKTIVLKFNYKTPSEEEAKIISTSSIDNKEIKKAYGSHYRTLAIKWFVFGLICAVIGAVSIFVMNTGINGPLSFLISLSENLLAVLSIIMPLGSLVFFIFAILYFTKSFIPSSTRPKSPEELFKTLFDDNIYYPKKSGSVDNLEKWIDFGCKRLCNLVPEELRITQVQFANYYLMITKIIERAEKIIKQAIDNESKSRPDFKGSLKNSSIDEDNCGISININSIRELYHSVYEVNAVFTKSYTCSDSKLNKYATAILEFNIQGILVKSGEYWYPYDLMPELTIVS